MRFYSDFNAMFKDQATSNGIVSVYNFSAVRSDCIVIKDVYGLADSDPDDVVCEVRPVSADEWPEFVPDSPMFQYRKFPQRSESRNIVEYKIHDKYLNSVGDIVEKFFEETSSVKRFCNLGNGRLLVDYSCYSGPIFSVIKYDVDILDERLQPILEEQHK